MSMTVWDWQTDETETCPMSTDLPDSGIPGTGNRNRPAGFPRSGLQTRPVSVRSEIDKLHTPDLWLLMQIKYVLNILPNFHIYFIIFTFVLPNFDIQIHTEIMCFSKPKKSFLFQKLPKFG